MEKANSLFPVFLKLENFRVLIVGGGNVALEKVSSILSNSPATKINLVAINVSDEIRKLSIRYNNLTIHNRSFETSDLDNTDLVITAINNKEASLHIKNLAVKKNILANVADTPDQCDFYLGSIVQKGNVKIAISTNGKSPTLAKRLRETMEESFPAEINESIDSLGTIRRYLKGDFSQRVKQLNDITSVLAKNGQIKKISISKTRLWTYSFSIPLLLSLGYLFYYYFPPEAISDASVGFIAQLDSSFFYYTLAGFTAQMIDGALGMAYGVTATTFLLSGGISPAISSASVHASEIFTSGVSGLMHLKFGNVNTKLFRNLLLPGVIGAVLGALILTSYEDYNYITKPVVSVYTLFLGIVIVFKAFKRDRIRERIKRLFPLALAGGFLDSVGGGGWGPIVSSTLIARGRNARYAIGSVNLAEFFVSLASSATFFMLIGIQHWTIVAGLVVGGIIAAPIAAYLANKLPNKTIMIFVGIVVIIASTKRLFF